MGQFNGFSSQQSCPPAIRLLSNNNPEALLQKRRGLANKLAKDQSKNGSSSELIAMAASERRDQSKGEGEWVCGKDREGEDIDSKLLIIASAHVQ